MKICLGGLSSSSHTVNPIFRQFWFCWETVESGSKNDEDVEAMWNKNFNCTLLTVFRFFQKCGIKVNTVSTIPSANVQSEYKKIICLKKKLNRPRSDDYHNTP